EKAKDYNFIAINAGDSPKKIKRFIKKYKFKYNILQDRSRELSKSWGIDSLPITVILDSNGKVIYSGIRPPKSLL
ncbi:TlpA disulfide reductase family protein, partial [Bacteriovorax sp. DB6_IX]|uniref:TlpA family protein disulfide reductase n=1 Tax=Bacteriovorax sp. DB6_IX TaxID=1353530 RepID=UPI000553FB3C